MEPEFRIRKSPGVVAAVVLAIGWSVFAFGAAADEYRTAAVILAAVAAVIALVRLPGPGWRPPLPVVPVAAGGLLLLYGWFMVLNAHSEHSLVMFEFTRFEWRLADWAPGTIARRTSIRSMLELTVVLLAFVAALRATQSNAWRHLLAVFAVLGALVSLTGILHKAVGADAVWFVDFEGPPTFFAPFVYNANAGQFMNLTMPVAFGLWLSHAFDAEKRAWRGLWIIVVVVTIVGILTTASKAAVPVVGASLVMLVAVNRRRLVAMMTGTMRQRGRRIEPLVLVVALAALAVVLAVIGISLLMSRWEEFMAGFEGEKLPQTLAGRLQVIEVLTVMVSPAEGSWHGFGPGTFRHLIPHFALGTELRGRWNHAHCDPGQTIAEWGYLGAAAWFTIGAGAVIAAVLLCSRKRLPSDEMPIARGMAIGLTVVGLHSAMDFPFSIFSIHLAAMLMCGIIWGLWARGARPKA